MDSNSAKTIKRLSIGCVLLILLTVLSLLTGKYSFSPGKLLSGDEQELRVFVTLRLSRTIVAVFGGFVLGVSGFVYQTVFRNPLASQDIIGVSSGASAGAAFGILFFGSALMTTLSSFLGAIIALLTALLIASVDRNGHKSTIVLAGIAVHALSQAVLMILKLTADPERQLSAIEFWIMGSLAGIRMQDIGWNFLLASACIAGLFLLYRQIILLSAETGEARMLGVSVGRMRLFVLLLATMAVSSVVSLTGLVSFVGLLAPHSARLLTKDNRPGTMLLSGLIGALLLTAADILARTLAKTELPVSIFTSLFGAPFLVALAMKRKAE